MISPLGAKDQVVNVDKNRVSASWNHAPPAIAAHHLASYCRRHVLSRSCRGGRSCGVRSVARRGHACRADAHVGLVILTLRRCSSRGRDTTQMLRVTARHLDDLGTHFDGFTSPML